MCLGSDLAKIGKLAASSYTPRRTRSGDNDLEPYYYVGGKGWWDVEEPAYPYWLNFSFGLGYRIGLGCYNNHHGS